MKVLVTGAAGRLGSLTVELLAAAGHDVVGTDVAARRPLPVPLHEINLMDDAAVATLMGGVEALIHLGNHAGLHPKTQSPPRTFAENTAMNMNVFHAASAAGVKKIVFASTIQVIASEADWPTTPPHASNVAYLPLDSASPANPTNPYALSKYLGELMLADYFVPRGLSAVALRLPGLVNLAKPSARFQWDHEPQSVIVAQGFGYLSYADAAALVLAILRADLPGFRVYLPARSMIIAPLVRPAVERYYPGIPLRRPIEEIESLIDNSKVCLETGWSPKDTLPAPPPPT